MRYLSRTLTCSKHLKAHMLAKGYPPNQVGVVKLGIPLKPGPDLSAAGREHVRKTLLQVAPDTVVIAFVARLESQKRPWLLPARCLHCPFPRPD